MNARRLYLLIAAAVLAVAVAIVINTMREPRVGAGGENRRLVPQLNDHLNDVAAIKLTGAGDQVIATLKRGGNGWTIDERSGYPADVTKIREFLLKLDNARIVEAKTASPKRYADIGVDDVKNTDATGVRVQLEGLAEPVSLIIGSSNARDGEGTFVRREGEAQSYLTTGNLKVGKKTTDWANRDLANIAEARIKSVTLTAPDGRKVTVYKERSGDNLFKVADMPKDRNGSAMMLQNVATNLASLKAEDVAAAKDMPPPDNVNKAEYATFDGLTVTAIAWQKDGRTHAQFGAKLDPAIAQAHVDAEQAGNKSDAEAASAKDRAEKMAALQKEVETLNQTFTGWTFVLQPHRFEYMSKTMDELLDPIQPKPVPPSEPRAGGVNAKAAK